MFQGQESRWVLIQYLRIKIYFAALFLATNKESFFQFGQKNKGGIRPPGSLPWISP